MELSAIWRRLPGDLTEKILSQLVDIHFRRDPAYTWTKLRHTSAHQKRVIEYRFGRFWLPKLSITLYAGASHKFEYAFDLDSALPNTDADDTTTFAVQLHIHHPIAVVRQESRPGKLTHKYLRDAWASYNPATHRNLTVRLGEGYLGGGCRGAYILNDTDLPGLQVLEGGKIRFRWKEAMNELLREEMYMRRVGNRMFADAYNEWCASHPQPPTPVLGNIQVKIWRCKIQFARRVAALKHRAAKQSPRPIELRFSAFSKRLHKQEPDPDSAEILRAQVCCSLCSRTRHPDIFEVVLAEESVVPRLEVFQPWLERQQHGEGNDNGKEKLEVPESLLLVTVLDLYRDEYAWTCQYYQTLDGEEEEEGKEWVPMQRFWKAKEEVSARSDGLQALLLGDQKIRWELPP